MPATDLGVDLQTRIFSILDSDATLDGLIGDAQIYDHVPDELAFPFVVIGDTAADEWHTHSFDGFQGTIEIRVWAQSDVKVGKKQVYDIMSRIWTLLNNVDLAVPNRQQINFRCTSKRVIVEDDNRTYQGQMSFDYKFGGNE